MNWPERDYWAAKHPLLCGQKQLAISRVASSASPYDNAVIFVSDLSESALANVAKCQGCLVLLHEKDRERSAPLAGKHGLLYSDDPRYQFAEVMEPLWNAQTLRGRLSWNPVHGTAIGENVHIDSTAVVEPGVTIAHDCVIGPRAYIMTGVRLGPHVRIGEGSVIRENAVIGGWGFGFAISAGKRTIRIPHVGGVVIGNNVEIGALTTVCSGTIDPTVVEDHVVTDDHVHIGHNCRIQSNVVITACAEISGSVGIGQGAWLAPNCSIIDRVTLGDNVVVGIGAVVTKSFESNCRIGGHPARRLQKNPPS